jgi:hypothetical protein
LRRASEAIAGRIAAALDRRKAASVTTLKGELPELRGYARLGS